MNISQLLDYINGVYYWFFVSILTIAGILAPSIFLMFRVFFLSINPILYLIVYFPVFLASLMSYLAIMGRYGYGLREFMHHQGIQFVVSLPVTIAFIWWVLRRRKSFRVTPKGTGAVHLTTYHTYYLAIIALLTAAIVIGAFNAIHTGGDLFYAYVINLFRAGWWLVMALLGFYISLALPVPENAVRRVSQSYEGLEHHVLQLLICGIQLERVIAKHYFRLAEVHGKYSEVLRRIAEDSARHAEIYARLLRSLKRLRGLSVEGVDCGWTRPTVDKVVSSQRLGVEDLGRLVFIAEEVMMKVYAELVIETCSKLGLDVEEVKGIMKDEEAHERLLESILGGSTAAH
ncbi:hypothetical protein JCM16161A_15820 [Vulcanisaeta sp. JCM 16161]|uniref:hypothetical protein n=1 Tax=Vulcanisaeta sp. JCM 16161 TaxID=1295372 RepID=UPI0006D247B9|nr:hypothetical protein [Vulcanisaeta sp. JCM 16161]